MILLMLAGLISGAIGAMGIGGGVILIPVLTGIFDFGQREAQYVNLLYFLPVAICAIIIHTKNKRICYKAAIPMAFGGLLGAWAGSAIAMKISTAILGKMFGWFLVFIGLNQIFAKPKTNDKK